MTHRQISRLAWACAGLAMLSSCGIPSTDVVEAGAPATGLRPMALVYFLDKNQLVAVVTGESATTPEAAVRILLRGPEVSKDRGLTTALSRIKPLSVQSRRGSTVIIRLPAFVKRPSRLGLDQLVCTAAAAEVIAMPDAPSVTVVVSTSGGWRYTGRSSDCPAN